MSDDTSAIAAARQLQRVLEDFGEVAEIHDATVRLPNLGLKTTIAELELGPRSATVVYDLGSSRGEGLGLTVLAVGLGDTQEKALSQAALQWVTGVFSVVRHWLAPSAHTCLADDMDMLVHATNPDETFGWRVHIGPLISRYFANSDAGRRVRVENVDIIRALFDHVHARAAHQTVFWIEAFAARHPDGHVDATCRLHNDDWIEGRDALIAWAATWSIPSGTTVSMRQFFLFEPVDPREIRNHRLLTKAVSPSRDDTRPWWKRLFRIGS